MATVKAVIPALTKELNSFPIGDKRRQALMRAVTALEAHFGKSENEALTGASMQQMQQATKMGQGLPTGNPMPPGMSLGGPSPIGPPPGLAAMAGGM